MLPANIRDASNSGRLLAHAVHRLAAANVARQQVRTLRAPRCSLLGLINGILDLSKIEAGKLELENYDFNLRELIEDVTYSFSEAAGEKGLELSCFISSNVPPAIVGDAGRLRQIFVNLISNALKFTERGEIVVEASLIEASASSALIGFEVKDTGIGISETDQARIFGAFSQADGSMKRRYGGTGLGLSIAKDLCEMMGGSIEVTSEQGVGSTFRFSARFAQQAASVQQLGSRARRGNGLRVLVVDDNPANRKILQDHLLKEGIRVATANSGAEALGMARTAASRRAAFDVALVDMMMPDMNRLELARAIKLDPGLASLQVVLLTSLGQEVPETCNYVAWQLIKPIRGRELLDCLDALATGGASCPATASCAAAAADRSVSQQGAIGAGRHILLVEDSPVNTDVAVGILDSFGCTVETASHGREALAIHARRDFDVIFMDCQMPEMDGFETTAEIRRREAAEGRRTPIVALTANAIKGDRERCLKEGMDDYLAKPFTTSQMASALKAVFAGSVMCDAAAASDQPVAVAAFSATDVLDESVLASLRQLQCAGRPDIVRRTIGLYMESAPQLLTELQEGAASGDVAALGRASHSLKSNSANVGAMKLAAQCNDLEKLARSGMLAEACALVREVLEDYAVAKAMLSEHLERAA